MIWGDGAVDENRTGKPWMEDSCETVPRIHSPELRVLLNFQVSSLNVISFRNYNQFFIQ